MISPEKGVMPTQQYIWLAALSMVALLHRHSKNDDPPDAPLSALTDVSGIAGRLQHHDAPAANDPTAALLVLIPVLWQFCAINSAKPPIHGAVFCKITRRRFFGDSPLRALAIGAYVAAAIDLAL